MRSRMEKYYNDEALPRRTEKNQELYKEVNKGELDKFRLNSNASILEEDGANINIAELKTILDKKYDANAPKRKSIFIDEEIEPKEEIPEVTKEYDINTILERAHEEKEEDYEENRFKKVTDTQYDILKSLTITKEAQERHEEIKKDQDELMNLINTITAKELESTREMNPLDILSDLKGDDNTEIIAPMKDENANTFFAETTKIDDSFYTNSNNLTKDDFVENIGDEETEPKNPLAWIIIILVSLVLLAGIAFLVNKYFNLGLF